MSKNRLLIGILAVVAFGLILRIVPTRGNNFYFTMDIANEATKAREIIFWRLHPLVGQETSIQGFYHGPLWLYYISIGYLTFNFHPFGSLFMLFLLNAATTAVLTWQIAKKVSPKVAIVIGASIQLFWPYYDTTRFAFSPFPLVSIAILDILLLAEALQGNSTAFILAAIVSSLPSHLEVASLPPFIALLLVVGIWSFLKKKITNKQFLIGILALVLTHTARITSEILTGFSQLHKLQEHVATQNSFVSNTQFQEFLGKMVKIIQEGLVPSNTLLSIIVAMTILVVLFKLKKVNIFIKNFYLLTLILALFTLFWFSSNTGWHPWHTVYIPPLFFIAALLAISCLSKKYAVFLYMVLMLFQIQVFVKNYAYNFRPTTDASLLANELAAVDWTYKESRSKGFYVYSYLPSVYDYPYQYLYWWRGTQKYKYVPCEYTTYPGIPDFFINNYEKYQQPQKPCENIRYLIIEPDNNVSNQELWLSQVRKNTSLEKETKFGTIRVEKRRIGS
jgi:hypothetical protein